MCKDTMVREKWGTRVGDRGGRKCVISMVVETSVNVNNHV